MAGPRRRSTRGDEVGRPARQADRPESLPGEKDRHEVFEILDDLDPERLGQRLAQASRLSIDQLVNAVSEAFDYLRDLDEVRRSQRAAIDAIVARTGGFVREWRENGLVELEAGGSMVPTDATTASSVSTNDGNGRAVQCRWITADGTRCEMRLRPGSKCPHHPWTAP